MARQTNPKLLADFFNKIGLSRHLVRRSDMSGVEVKPEVFDARSK
jgi:hypothetical protein